jgi:hypothetical protein
MEPGRKKEELKDGRKIIKKVVDKRDSYSTSFFLLMMCGEDNELRKKSVPKNTSSAIEKKVRRRDL